MTDLPPLSDTTLWEILHEQLPDEAVNALLWQYLGYRQDPQTLAWDNANVPAEWREAYPEPPDFIDSRPATVRLTRSIPEADKQLLKSQLGFGGYQIAELNPRRTRRATAVSWLLSYRQQQQEA